MNTMTENKEYGIIKRMIKKNRDYNVEYSNKVMFLLNRLDNTLHSTRNELHLHNNKIELLEKQITDLTNRTERMEYFIYDKYGKKFNGALKNKIRYRDNYTCQDCGITERQTEKALHIHHIDFDKSNNKPNNLIALCASCHGKRNGVPKC